MTRRDAGGDGLQDVLYTELHHRFYNSLQVIAALAGRFSRRDFSAEMHRGTAIEIQNRVAILADLHRLLAEPHGDDLQNSCSALCVTLAAAFEREDVSFDLSICHARMDYWSARGLMLMLAELVTNAIKHNRASDRLAISVELTQRSSGYDLIVRNSGSLMGASAKPRVASQLANKLGGMLTVDIREGFAVYVSIPITI